MANENDESKHDPAFEQTVRETLRRVEAPDGFTERVMARRTARPGRPASLRGRGMLLQMRSPVWRAALAAAALLAITTGSLRVEHVRAEHRRESAAAAQFSQALQMTVHALNRVDAQLQQTSAPLFSEPQISKVLQEAQ